MYVVWMPVMQFTAACDIIDKKLSDRVHELSPTGTSIPVRSSLAQGVVSQHAASIMMELGWNEARSMCSFLVLP